MMATDRAYAAAVERAAALLGAARAAASAAEDAARNGSANAQGLAERARAVAAAASQALASIGYGPAGGFGYNPGESEEADDAAYAAGVAERARALAEAGQSRDIGRNISGGLRGLKGWNSTPNADDAARALKGGASRLGGEPAPEPPEPGAYKGPILTPPVVEEGDDAEEGDDPAPAGSVGMPLGNINSERDSARDARAQAQAALDALVREIAARQADADARAAIDRAARDAEERDFTPNLGPIELGGSTNNSGREKGAYGDRAANPAMAQAQADARAAALAQAAQDLARARAEEAAHEAAREAEAARQAGPSTIASGSGAEDGTSGGAGSTSRSGGGGSFGPSVADRARGALAGVPGGVIGLSAREIAQMQEANASPFGVREGGIISRDPNPQVIEITEPVEAEASPASAQRDNARSPTSPVAAEASPASAQRDNARSPTLVNIPNPGTWTVPGFTLIIEPGAYTNGELDAVINSDDTARGNFFSPDPAFGGSAALQAFAKEAPESSGFKGGFANNPGWAWGMDPAPAFDGTTPAAQTSPNAFAFEGFSPVAGDPEAGFTNAFGGSPSAQAMGYGVVGVNAGVSPGEVAVGAGTMNSAQNPAGGLFGGSAALQGFALNAFEQESAPDPSFAPDPTIESTLDGYGMGRESDRGKGFGGIGIEVGKGRSSIDSSGENSRSGGNSRSSNAFAFEGFSPVAGDPEAGFTNAFGGSPSAQAMGYGVVGVNAGVSPGEVAVGAGTMNSAQNPAGGLFGGSAALQGFALNAFEQESAPDPSSAPDPTIESTSDGYGMGRESDRGKGFGGIGIEVGAGRSSIGSSGENSRSGGNSRSSNADADESGSAKSGPTFNPGDGSIDWGDGTVTPGPGQMGMNTQSEGETELGATSEHGNQLGMNAFDNSDGSDLDKDKDFGGNAFDLGGFDLGLGGFGIDLGGYA